MYFRPSTSRRLLGLTALFTPVPFVGLMGLAHAANQTYLDTSLLNTWNLADANWDAGAAWVDHNSAIFGGTGEAVTVTAVTADGITFNSAGYSLTGGTFTLGQSTTPIVANADVAISTVIAGSGTGFAKGGNGTLTLGAANTFDGLIDVNAGTLKLGAASSAGSGSTSILVLPGATLDFGGFNAGTRPISIAGTGVSGAALYNSSVTAASALGATVTLDGDTSLGSALNTSTSGISATINLSGFTLTMNSGRWVTSNLSSGNITVNSGGVILLGNGTTEAAGTLKINTGGIVDVRDFNNTARTDTLAITLNGGLVGNANPLGSGGNGNGGGASGQTLKNAIFVDTPGGTLNGNNTAFGNTVANFGLSFSGALTGSGPLALSGGKGINLKGDTSGYTGTATNTTTLLFNAGASNQAFNGVIAGTGSLTQNGTGVLTLAGNNTYTGATTAASGTLVLTGSNTSTTGTTTVSSGSTLRLDYGTNNNRKIPSGVLTLGGAIELAGGTAFTDSVASTTLSGGSLSSVRRTSGTNLIDLKAITPGTGRVDFAESGIATTTNANNAQGILGNWATVGGTAWAKNDGTGLIVAVAPTGTVARRSGVAQTIPNNAAAEIQIIEGAGTASNIGLAAATTTINSLTQSSVGGSSPAIIDPAGQTLAVNGILVGTGAGSLTIGSGVNSGTLKSATTALTFRDLAGVGITVNSVIADGTGASSLTKFDSGTLTLNAANTYTGGTILNDGVLRLGIAAALPSGQSVAVNNAGTLDLNANSPTITNLTGSGNVTDNAAGFGTSTLTLTAGSGTVANKITNGASRVVALRVTNSTNNLVLNNAGNTFSGGIVLTNSGTGTRMSPGTIVAGAYGTGPITVGEAATDKAGIYFATANQTLANPIISNTGLGTDRAGTFRVDALGTVLSGQLTANLAPMTFSTNGTGAVTASGKITGPNGLTLQSQSLGGTSLGVTLSNAANDYAGDTLINQGAVVGKNYTLTLGAANVIPNGAGKGSVTITTNGTGVGRLNMGGFSETINGLSGNGTVDGVSGTPTLTVGDNNATSSFTGTIANAAGTLALGKIGTGTLTLGGANTYGGATTVQAGTLAITGAPTGNGAFNVNGGILSLVGSPAGNNAVNVNGGVLSLDYGTNNTSKINNAAVLTLNGGTVTLAGATGDHTEAVASTTLAGGVTLNRSGANTAKLALGAITRSGGGALEVASAGLATTTTSNNADGILPGVTLAGGLAMNDGSGNIVAYAGAFADVSRLGGVINNGATSQVRIVSGGTSGNIALGGSGTNTVSTLSNNSTDGLATVDIATGRVLRLGAGGSIISPSTSMGLTFNGPGTLTAGGTDNTAGDLLVLNQSATATNIGAVIANNGTGAVSLTKFGSGALNLTGVNSFSGGVRVNEGSVTSLLTTTQNSLGTGAVSVSGGGTLSIDNTNTSGTTASVANIFSGGGTLQLLFANGTASPRTTSLTGTNALDNFTGTVRLSLAPGATASGDKLGNVNDTTPASLIIDPGAQLFVTTGTTGFTGGITISGAGNSENRGAIRMIGTLAGNLNLAGNATIGTEGGTVSGSIVSGAAGTQTLTIGGTSGSTGTTTFSGSIGGGTGTLNVVKAGTATANLTAANTFTTPVLVSDGVLVSSHVAGLGGATEVNVQNGDSSGNNTNSFQLGGGTVQGNGVTLTLHNSATTGTIGNARSTINNASGNNTWLGNIVLRGGLNQALANDTASTTLTINGSVTQHATEPTSALFIRGTSTVVMNGSLTLGAATTVTKTDTGTFTINSSGNTWGNTGVAVGTLRLGAVNALPAATLVTMGQGDGANTTLDLNGFSQTIGGLGFSSTGGTKLITSTNAATLTVNNAAASSFGGVLGGAGLSLAKSGAGTLTLSGVNTYTGNTTVSAGTLELADNARLRFVIGATSGVTNSISGAGTATLAGDFAIDTTAAAALTSGSWLIENVATLTGPYGATFQVVGTDGTPWTDAGGDKWTKTEGANTWTFNEATGMLTLGEVGYDSWASVIPNANDRDRGDDPDGDGFTNLQEYLFGTSPISGGGSLLGMSRSGSNVTLRWLQLESGGAYVLKHNAALSGAWTTVVSPVPALDANQTGAPADYDYYTVTLPIGAGRDFFRIEGTEN